MPDRDDDLFGDHDPEESEMEELQAFRDALLARIGEAIDEHEIPEGLAALLLVEIAVTLRATAYGLATEKPSVSGLKLDLDRFRREVDEMLRAMKKDAEQFVAQAKEVRAELPEDPE